MVCTQMKGEIFLGPQGREGKGREGVKNQGG